MTFPRIRRALALGCVASVAMLAACSDAQDRSTGPQASTLERAVDAGKIRVGYANEAPFAFIDSRTGELSGEAPVVLRQVMSDLDIDDVEAVLTEFGSLIPGLQAGRFDVIAAGMYITPERCSQVAFSNPTYGIGSALVVGEGNPLSLNSFADVADSDDATLGVVVGAIEADYARQSGVPSERMVVFPDAVSALAGVRAGQVDAYAATALTVNDLLAKRSDGVERAQPFTDPVIDGASVRGYGAFAFRPADTELVEAFNNSLADYIGTEEHAEAVGQFGFTEAELPKGATAAMLCG